MEQEGGGGTLFRQRSLAVGELGGEETSVRGLVFGWLAGAVREGLDLWWLAHRGAAGEEKGEWQDPFFGDFLFDFLVQKEASAWLGPDHYFVMCGRTS